MLLLTYARPAYLHESVKNSLLLPETLVDQLSRNTKQNTHPSVPCGAFAIQPGSALCASRDGA